jgi:hypothetical protein
MTRSFFLSAFVSGSAVAAVAAAAGFAGAQTPPPAGPVPVLVELFTSEGCSSCPPADDVLTRLVATQPVAGAQVIALGEHVDYWDHLGWRDAFSSATFSRRQTEYADRVFHGGSIYTPQLVVNGRQEVVGSDYRKAVAAISNAAKAGSRLRVSLTVDPATNAQRVAQLHIASADGTPLKDSAEVWLAIVENGLTTRVARGENGGRTLQHSAVVRTIRNVTVIPGGSSNWSGSTPVTLAPDWNRSATRLVAFAQDRANRQVLGAAVAAP